MTEIIFSGNFLLAAALAALAGLVSFLSPCVLPLAPGYLAYLTGVSGNSTPQKSRAVVATFLFILGFSLVFTSYGIFFGSLGSLLFSYAQIFERILGVLVIVLGIGFLLQSGWLSRSFKFNFSVRSGVWGAPFLGILFAFGWTPCIGPVLAAVQTMAFSEGTAAKGAALSFIYALGLGVPFLLLAFVYEKSITTVQILRRYQKLFMQIGAVLMIFIGVMLVSGLWSEITINLRVWISGFTPVI
jgi:cytochrome c-type biogenesis protein